MVAEDFLGDPVAGNEPGDDRRAGHRVSRGPEDRAAVIGTSEVVTFMAPVFAKFPVSIQTSRCR